MHPAHEVTPALHHEVVAVVAEPGRDRDTHARPLVRGALGIAVYHHYSVVQVELPVLELRFAEASAGGDFVRTCIQVQRRGTCILHEI